uniref:Uncharacterized protein n=1 Tax=Arundo donax TaxID=35708 RepID=A0A0A9H7K8_ARUDO
MSNITTPVIIFSEALSVKKHAMKCRLSETEIHPISENKMKIYCRQPRLRR